MWNCGWCGSEFIREGGDRRWELPWELGVGELGCWTPLARFERRLNVRKPYMSSVAHTQEGSGAESAQGSTLHQSDSSDLIKAGQRQVVKGIRARVSTGLMALPNESRTRDERVGAAPQAQRNGHAIGQEQGNHCHGRHSVEILRPGHA